MTVLFTAFSVFGQITPAFAQGEAALNGQIVAGADGSVIADARLTLSAAAGQILQGTSDEAGRFTFRSIVPGRYAVIVEADGFARRDVAVVLEPREIKTITIALDLGRIEASVEVTGDAAVSPSTHSPSSTLLTSDRLDHLPATQQQSLPDAIVVAAPGMIRGHDDFVHIRGHEVALNPAINGVSFWENPHALMSAGLSPGFIDTVNVMTGGFPAEYGNRFGGVLDIVTKSGLRMENEGSLTVSAGEAGRRNVAAEFGGHRAAFGYYVYGSMFQTDRFLSPPHPNALHDRGRAGHLFAQFDGALKRGGMIRAVLMADGANFEIPKHPRDLELRPLADAEQRTRQQSTIVGWTRAGSTTSIGAQFYQRTSKSQLLPALGPLTASADLDRRLTTIGGKADVVRVAGRHALKAGVEMVRLQPVERLFYNYAGYRDLTHLLDWPHIHVVGGPITFNGREAGSQVSAYVQDKVELGPRVSTDVGVRFDRYDLAVSATQVSPRLNIAFRVSDETLVHASYNHFFVPPPIEGVLSSNAGLTALIREIGRPLPAIEPTMEHQIELGASAPLGPFRAALTGYFRATDNPVHTTVWPDSRIYSYASFDRARAYGLETKIEVPVAARYGITGYLNYALGRVNFYNPVTGGFITEAGHLTETSRFHAPMDQTHTVTAGATYRHSRGLWLGTLVEYGSGTPMGHGGGDHQHAEGESDHEHVGGTGAVRTPSHATANLSMGIDLFRAADRRGRVSIQIDLENIADKAYLIAQEGEFSPAQYASARLFAATVKVRF